MADGCVRESTVGIDKRAVGVKVQLVPFAVIGVVKEHPVGLGDGVANKVLRDGDLGHACGDRGLRCPVVQRGIGGIGVACDKRCSCCHMPGSWRYV